MEDQIKKDVLDVSALSNEELVEKISDEKQRMQKMQFMHSVVQIDNTNEFKAIRKDIARMKTELRAREIAEASKK